MIGQKAISILLTVIFFTATTGFTLHSTQSCEMEPELVVVHHMDEGYDAMQAGRCLDHISHYHLTAKYAAPKAVSIPDLPSKRVSGDRPYTFAASHNDAILSGTRLIYYGSVASLRTVRHQSFTCSFLI